MEVLPAFDIVHPATLDDAVAALAGEGAMVLAGGTDTIPNIRRRLFSPEKLVDITALEELRAIEETPGGMILGAGVTLSALIENQAVAARYPALIKAARTIAGPQHRNAGTIGGNLLQDTRCVFYNQSEWWRSANDYCLKYSGDVCHVAPKSARCFAAYCSDLAPVLVALGSQAELLGPDGARRAPLEDLFAEDGAAHRRLKPGEILLRLHVPTPPAQVDYEKVRLREAIDFPLVGVAVALACEKGVLTSLRIALTGTNSRPLLLEETADFIGKAVDEAMLEHLVKLVRKQIGAMKTTLTTTKYRRQVAPALVSDMVRRLAAA
jgi:4-hydroxybenzoyl-CoA reductase subunit beta